MEIANYRTSIIRRATREDRGDIFDLLRTARYVHVHADWFLPIDWLGTPGFYLFEKKARGDKWPLLSGCIAAAADPLPAAWVRIAALRNHSNASIILTGLLEHVLPSLVTQGINQLGWLPSPFWPKEWITDLGFKPINSIVTYSRVVEGTVNLDEPGIVVRPVNETDIDVLAAIETRAFEPLWRHSAQGLRLANEQACSFLVAEVNGQIAGFQYSVIGHDAKNAHLVRITVDPRFQARGVGSTLMSAAMSAYRELGIKYISLNTQSDNVASHRLYERFGFTLLDEEAIVYSMNLERF